MKSTCICAAALLSISACWTPAQTQSSATEHATGAVSPPENHSASGFFYIVAEFTGSLNAGKLKVGDKVKAEVTQDVLSHGRIVIPADSKLLGHVTESRSRTAADPESILGIVFDRIVLKNHREVEFRGVIQSLEAPAERRSRLDEPDQMLPPGGLSAARGISLGGSAGHRSSSMGSDNSDMTDTGLTTGAPVYMNGTPGSNVGNSAGADLGHPSGGRVLDSRRAATPLGTGMPLGVYGIKGLRLSPGPTSNTPGPVITSSVHTVKLEYGTQVLVKGTDPRLIKPQRTN